MWWTSRSARPPIPPAQCGQDAGGGTERKTGQDAWIWSADPLEAPDYMKIAISRSPAVSSSADRFVTWTNSFLEHRFARTGAVLRLQRLYDL